jgi:hypothetical protein
MIYGGFELSTPNVPTDSIFKVALPKLFEISTSLTAKLKNLDSDATSNSSNSSVQSTAKLGDSGISRNSNTPNIRGSIAS